MSTRAKLVICISILSLVMSACGTHGANLAPVPLGTQDPFVRPPTPAPLETGTPVPADWETLGEWGIKKEDQVVLLTINCKVDATLLAAGVISFLPVDGEVGCANFWRHITKHVAAAEFTFLQVQRLVTEIANGTLLPDKIGIQNSTRVVIKYTFEGVKWILIGGSAVLPTLFVPDNAARVSSLFRTTQVRQFSNKIGVAIRAFADCLKRNSIVVPEPISVEVPVGIPVPDTVEVFETLPDGYKIRGNWAIPPEMFEYSQEEILLLVSLGILVLGGIILTDGAILVFLPAAF